jgi:ABC-type sulfate transport system permease subunit
VSALLFAPLGIVFFTAFENGWQAWLQRFAHSDTGAIA